MITPTRPSRLFPLAVFFLLSASVVGCGRGASDLALPTAPSGLTAPFSLTSAEDAAAAVAPDADSVPAGLVELAQVLEGSLTAVSEAGKSKFRGEGVVTAIVAGPCPTGTFKIGTHTIMTDTATIYEGGTCAGIVVGAKLDMEVTEQADGTFLASEVEFEEKPKHKFEGEGRITAIDPTARTITVEGHVILVPMTAILRHGDTPLTFADLKVGYRVHVRALRNVDGSLTAERIVVQETKSGSSS